MRPDDEDTWEAAYWDDLLHEFGVDAYITARWEQHPQPPIETEESCESDLHPAKRTPSSTS